MSRNIKAVKTRKSDLSLNPEFGLKRITIEGKRGGAGARPALKAQIANFHRAHARRATPSIAAKVLVFAATQSSAEPTSNSLLTGNLTGNFKFLAAGATIMASESRVIRTLV